MVVQQVPVKKRTQPATILTAVIASLIIVDLLFVAFTQGAGSTVRLLKNELRGLEEQEKIITSSQEIYETYKDDVEVISNAFPNEETIAVFIQYLERELRAVTPEYTLKFNSVTPIKEQDKLFLPLTIMVKANFSELTSLFTKWENFPYMMHITSILAKTPDGFSSKSEVTLVVKVYVQNPFST